MKKLKIVGTTSLAVKKNEIKKIIKITFEMQFSKSDFLKVGKPEIRLSKKLVAYDW